METSASKPSLPATAANDLYTIPSSSSWFQWDSIHEVERMELREFFDGSSFTRSPRIYKEYRDFIISKYREDPSRKLTFTAVRKSLVGDVTTLSKVFKFLEKYGLINFGKAPADGDEAEAMRRWVVRVEEGAPHGIKVVLAPNSTKVATPPPPSVMLPPLQESEESKSQPFASYSDVYGELLKQEEQEKELMACGVCKERCDSGHYNYTKEKGFILCKKCFEKGDCGGKSVTDFEFIDDKNEKTIWTEAETLLLLESVLKHGDDWELVAENVKTKTKLDCISKLLQLPFGNFMLGSSVNKSRFWEMTSENLSVGHTTSASSMNQDSANSVVGQTFKASRKHQESDTGNSVAKSEEQNNVSAEEQGPPQKKLCTISNLDASSYLMKQVARISAVVGSSVTASAADAAVAELCYENKCSRVIFDGDKKVDELKSSAPSNDKKVDELKSSAPSNDMKVDELKSSVPSNDKKVDELKSSDPSNDMKVDESAPSNEEEKVLDATNTEGETHSTIPEPPEPCQENVIPVAFRMRAATATSLGVAAAHAKLLADQEERYIESLLASIIETQLKKMKHKAQILESVEEIMEKQYELLDETEETMLEERINVLQHIFSSGIPRWKDPTYVKSNMGS